MRTSLSALCTGAKSTQHERHALVSDLAAPLALWDDHSVKYRGSRWHGNGSKRPTLTRATPYRRVATSHKRPQPQCNRMARWQRHSTTRRGAQSGADIRNGALHLCEQQLSPRATARSTTSCCGGKVKENALWYSYNHCCLATPRHVYTSVKAQRYRVSVGLERREEGLEGLCRSVPARFVVCRVGVVCRG